MLKQDISYKDFDDNEQVETLHFNITQTELSENLHLKSRLETIQTQLAGVERDLTIPEIEMMLELVKTFMKLSYGVRSADGKRFAKSDQIWEEFTQTAAYDAFLVSLFENPKKAHDFMIGVMPANLREAVVAEISQAQSPAPVTPAVEQKVAEQPEKAKDDEPSDEELLTMKPTDMTPEQLRRAYILKTQ